MNKSIDNLDLLAQLAADLATPIAKELQALFDRGGSKDDGVQLVAALERIALSAVAKKRESARHSARGTRLNADWQPSTAEVQYALDRGLSRNRVTTEAEKFKNYWTAKSGANATKRDWSATWRNWVMSTVEKTNAIATGTVRPGPGFALTGSAAILAGVAAAADRRAQERGAGRQHGQTQADGSAAGIDDADGL